MTETEAKAALEKLLWELPMIFGMHPDEVEHWDSFQVIKKSNVRKVHEALWDLQRYFGVNQEN